MPIARLLEESAFDASSVAVIASAFDDALKELHLERTDPLAEIVAEKIIECARLGERNPDRLRELATAGLR